MKISGIYCYELRNLTPQNKSGNRLNLHQNNYIPDIFVLNK